MAVLSLVITIAFIYVVIMVPIQYSYLLEMKKYDLENSAETYRPHHCSDSFIQSKPQQHFFFKPAYKIASWLFRIIQGDKS